MLQRQHNDTQSNQLLLTLRRCPTRYLSDVAPDVVSRGFSSSIIIEFVKRIWFEVGECTSQRRGRGSNPTQCATFAIYKVGFIIICLLIFRWMERQSHRCRRKRREARRRCFKVKKYIYIYIYDMILCECMCIYIYIYIYLPLHFFL